MIRLKSFFSAVAVANPARAHPTRVQDPELEMEPGEWGL